MSSSVDVSQSPSAAPVVSQYVSRFVSQAAGGLGALVFWDMSSTRITPKDLQEILDKHAIQLTVPPLVPRVQIARAARVWSHGSKGTTKWRADLVNIEDPNRIKVCLQLHSTEGTGARKKSTWTTKESVIFDVSRTAWAVSSQSFQVRSFRKLADRYLEHVDHVWIRPNLIQAGLSKMNGISLKTSSGLWYVPQDHMADLAVLQSVVSAIGNCHLHALTVSHTDASRDAAADGVRANLKERLEGLAPKLQKWSNTARKIRSDAVASTMDEFDDLMERADLYEGALQVRLDDLRAEIAQARQTAREIIDRNTSTHSDPNTKPLGSRIMATLEAVQALRGNPATTHEIAEIRECGVGTIQNHLRELARRNLIHRSGTSEDNRALYLPGGAPEGEPEAEEETPVVEEQVQPPAPVVPRGEILREEEPEEGGEVVAEVQPEPAGGLSSKEAALLQLLSSHDLSAMSRSELRTLERQVRPYHRIRNGAKLGRPALSQALLELRQDLEAKKN